MDVFIIHWLNFLVKVIVGSRDRMVIPSEIRKRLCIKKGTELKIDVDENGRLSVHKNFI